MAKPPRDWGRPPTKGGNSIVTMPDERLHEKRRPISSDGVPTRMPNDMVGLDRTEPTDAHEDDAVVLALARRRFQTSVEAESIMRLEMVEDQRFYGGDQWPATIKADRASDQRPILTINRLPQFVKQITNPQRQSRPSIQVNPVSDGADVETAEIIQGLIRHIENTSHADVAYDEAYKDAVVTGRGWFRILTDYVHDGTFEQELLVRRIANPLSVYPDPAAVELDYSDGRYLFVVEDIPKDEYRDLYGDASMASLELFTGAGNRTPEWFPEGYVRVAEYFTVETKKRTLALIRGANGEPLTVPLEQVPQGVPVERRRTVNERIVKWYKINAAEILERKVWPGKWIPVVPVLGDEVYIDGRRTLVGIVRYARDPQRMYNYWAALKVDTPIPTPLGWSTIGDIQPGDEVLDSKGHPCTVLGKSPVHRDRECFTVTFDDGSSIVADADHPWQVEERGRRQDPTWEWTTKQVTTRDLTPKKHFIWATKPLQLTDADLPIHPYTLGLWLSDGNSSGGVISQNTTEIEELRTSLAISGERFGPVGTAGDGHGRFRVDGLTTRLRRAGLLHRKHIPGIYLRASLAQRLALLMGLMDGDGSVAQTSRQCEFSTGSVMLRDGMCELLRTLGIKAKYCTRQPRNSTVRGRPVIGRHPVYQFSFSAPPPETMPVFTLARKLAGQQAKHGKYHPRRTDRWCIVSVEPTASVPVQCIGVDSPDHLYLAGPSMIPTHNSAETETIALAPRAPFVGAEGQFKNHPEWKTANVKNHSYLEYVPVSFDGKPMPAPQRQQYEPPIRAIVEAIKQADNDLKSVTGLYDASLGERGPDQSGRAILARQKQGETANVNFIDNLGRSLWHGARIYLDLIPKVYDAPRVIHITGMDDQRKRVVINDPDNDLQQEAVKRVFDVRVGRYNVSMSIGPSYQSKRQEAVASMLELVKASPQIVPIIGDLMVGEMDWPMARQIAARLKKTLPQPLQDDGDEGPTAEQLQAKVAQLTQAVQQRESMLTEAIAVIKEKKIETLSAESQTAMQERTKLTIAMAKIGADQAGARLKMEVDGINQRLDADNQRVMDELADLRKLHADMTMAQHAADVQKDQASHEAGLQAQMPGANGAPAAAGGLA